MTANVTGATAGRAHGTRAKYVVEKCRCDECRRACAEYERERTARIAPPYVLAEPARQHVRHLMSLGMGFKRVAEVAGVSPSAVASLLYGKKVGDKHRPPTKRIRPETAAALLAVDFDPNDGALIDPAEMWRQVEEMVAAGIPRTRIAERVDVGVRNLYPKGEKVTAARARTVAEMYAEFTAGTLVTVRRSRHGDRTLTFDPVEHERDERLVDEYLRALGRLAEVFEKRNEQAEWRRSAACVGRPTWMWFPARGDRKTYEAAVRICKSCTVRQQCLAANLDERDGIYGGLGSGARQELRSQRGVERRCLACDEPFTSTNGIGYCSEDCRHDRRLQLQYESNRRTA